jgi:hypothetical protein
MFTLIFVLESKNGHMAEWSGMGLQNLLRRFESVCDLSLQFKLYGKQSLKGCISIHPNFILKLNGN